MEHLSIVYLYFVPINGTKVDKRVILVQFQMINSYSEPFLDFLYRYKLLGFEYIDFEEVNKIESELSNLPSSIVDLDRYTKNCNLCNLSKNNIGLNFSNGNSNNNIWVIGITPSFYINDMIRKVLNKILVEDILLNLEDVYFTNILKCNTSQTLNSLSNEINICIDYLYREIEICKPKVIITLGEAFNYIMNKNDNIIDIYGNIYNLDGIYVIPLYDMEYLIKNPSSIYKINNGLNKIKKILER